jgi:ribosomal protein L12E/L44/L45/RPP1/RPP2
MALVQVKLLKDHFDGLKMVPEGSTIGVEESKLSAVYMVRVDGKPIKPRIVGAGPTAAEIATALGKEPAAPAVAPKGEKDKPKAESEGKAEEL